MPVAETTLVQNSAREAGGGDQTRTKSSQMRYLEGRVAGDQVRTKIGQKRLQVSVAEEKVRTKVGQKG